MGRSWILCRPRMPLCGGLRIGVERSEPYTPPLEMVKTPPCRSSILILPSPRFLGVIEDGLLDLGEALAVRLADDRHDQALLGADGHADVEVMVHHEVAFAFQAGIDLRHGFQRGDGRFHEERHEAELHAVLLLERAPASACAGS